MASRVLVSTLAGVRVEVELVPSAPDLEMTISDLKKAIAKSVLKIPRRFQKIVTYDDPVELQDSMRIESAHYQVIITLDALHQLFKSGNRQAWKNGLKDLQFLSLKHGEAASRALLSFLKHPVQKVKERAFKMFTLIVQKVDHQMMPALIEFFLLDLSYEADLRLFAICKKVNKDDQSVISFLTDLLNEPTDLTKAYSTQESAKKRVLSLKMISRIAETGNQEIIATISSRFTDDFECVRLAAFQAIIQVATRGEVSEHIMAKITSTLRNDARSIASTIAALEAIAQVGIKGEQLAINAIAACLEFDDFNVKTAAGIAFVRLFLKGEEELEDITAVSRLLMHRNGDVRRGCIPVLIEMSQKKHDHVTASVIEYLDHSDGAVRCAAVRTLGSIVDKGDERAVLLLSQRSEDRELQVRVAAKQVLDCLR